MTLISSKVKLPLHKADSALQNLDLKLLNQNVLVRHFKPLKVGRMPHEDIFLFLVSHKDRVGIIILS